MAGLISPEHIDRISNLSGKVGVDRLAPADGLLAEVAAETDPAGLAEVCARVHDAIDPEHGVPDPRRDFDNRGLTLSRHGAMLALRGRLDPKAGQRCKPR